MNVGFEVEIYYNTLLTLLLMSAITREAITVWRMVHLSIKDKELVLEDRTGWANEHHVDYWQARVSRKNILS